MNAKEAAALSKQNDYKRYPKLTEIQAEIRKACLQGETNCSFWADRGLYMVRTIEKLGEDGFKVSVPDRDIDVESDVFYIYWDE